MHRYQNILYVMNPNNQAIEGLKQALSMARNYEASLHVLLVYPKLPSELLAQKETFEAYLAQRLSDALEEARSVVENRVSSVTTEIMMIDESPAVAITRYVLRHEHDMLIKEAERMGEDERGFKALDMTLLRKCPTALYLARPITRPREAIRVAVAIDPMGEDAETRDLSLRLLHLARNVADSCNAKLEIVSCWDYPYEEYLRHNAWVKISNDNLAGTLMSIQSEHRGALEGLIKEADIGGEHRVHHLRGEASLMINEFVHREQIDILVMGTIARSGIAGFLIGNTAENIFEKLPCSLYTLKPGGFVSPIKAY